VITTGSCPYLPLCERDLVGPDLDAGEQERLQEHLSGGCQECESQIELNLKGDGPEGDPSAGLRQELDRLLEGAVLGAEEPLARSKGAVLARVRAEVARGQGAQRRLRRGHLRALFYVTNVAAVLLMIVAYMGTVAVTRLQQRQAQTLATQTELQAIATALTVFMREHPGPLPPDTPALLQALEQRRDQRGGPYYAFGPSRRGSDSYLDDFGRPYAYRPGEGRALVYSLGPDGRDDKGQGDDLAAWVMFVN
jgi:hypothetical protein